jgi:hypothetical protein
MALGLAALAPGLGLAQEQRPWVDPPAEGTAPAAPAPPPAVEAPVPQPVPRSAQPEPATPPVRSAEPSGRTAPAPTQDSAESQRLRHETAAQDFVREYLAFWSAPNEVALEAHRDFYAPSVNFHGDERSARSIFEEKRRVVRRWPERQYLARPGTMEAACDAGSDLCTVRTAFDFRASDPARGRRSEGAGTLEMVISFAGRDPVIISENSWVSRRGQERTVSLEEVFD